MILDKPEQISIKDYFERLADYWFRNDVVNVKVGLDDDGDWQCTAYDRKPDGQIDISERLKIKLNDEKEEKNR